MPPTQFKNESVSVRASRVRCRLIVSLIVGAIGVTACGSSSKPKPKTSTAVAATQTATSGSATTTTTTPTRKHARKPSHPKGAAHATTAAGAGASTQAPTIALHPTQPAATPASTVTPGPAALACLRTAGLHDVRKATEPGVDIGNVGNTSVADVNGMVFVDGPYKTVSKANTSAQSLLGVEYAARGGRYVVSATLRSHLNGTVQTVAACLGSKSAPGSKPAPGSKAAKKYTF